MSDLNQTAGVFRDPTRPLHTKGGRSSSSSSTISVALPSANTRNLIRIIFTSWCARLTATITAKIFCASITSSRISRKERQSAQQR